MNPELFHHLPASQSANELQVINLLHSCCSQVNSDLSNHLPAGQPTNELQVMNLLYPGSSQVNSDFSHQVLANELQIMKFISKSNVHTWISIILRYLMKSLFTQPLWNLIVQGHLPLLLVTGKFVKCIFFACHLHPISFFLRFFNFWIKVLSAISLKAFLPSLASIKAVLVTSSLIFY